MAETQSVDEVVSVRSGSPRGGLSARPVEDEAVSTSGAPAKISRSGVEEETHEGRRGRAFKASTEALLEKFEKESQDDARSPAPHEEGDADEDEGQEAGDEDSTDDAEAGEANAEGEPSDDAEPADEEAAPADEWQTKAATLEARNRELLSELDTARKTPKTQRSDRETALVSAEASYIEEGSIPALRKFLGVIVGAAPDSKEVDAELAGLYTDLTAKELGVSLDQNQQALRDNARTRLLLARDRREKVEAEKKPVADDAVDTVQYGEAARLVDNLLSTKGQSGTSVADEYPMLMALSKDFDGYAPGEVIARAIRQEIMTGTLDPKLNEIDLVRAVAPKIEKYYDGVASRIEAARAKQTNPGTTTPSVKPKAAIDPSKEQRQSPAARTLTNAAASRAPAKLPKPTAQKVKTTEKKSRKDFPTDAAWKDHLFETHFKS
jgi:hypothetical protein